MDTIFLNLGDIIANVDSGFTTFAGIMAAVLSFMKVYVKVRGPKKEEAQKSAAQPGQAPQAGAIEYASEKDDGHKDTIGSINRIVNYSFFGLFIVVLAYMFLAFLGVANLDSRADLERALAPNVSGEYDGMVNGTSVYVRIDSVMEIKDRKEVNMAVYSFNYEVKPFMARNSEKGNGEIVAQRRNFWEKKDFTVAFMNTETLKNMRGEIFSEKISNKNLYKIEFQAGKDFLIKKWN